MSWAINSHKGVTIIKTWPDIDDDRDNKEQDKVPTVLAYSPDRDRDQMKWGFCAEDSPVQNRWFKLLIDPSYDDSKWKKLRRRADSYDSDSEEGSESSKTRAVDDSPPITSGFGFLSRLLDWLKKPDDAYKHSSIIEREKKMAAIREAQQSITDFLRALWEYSQGMTPIGTRADYVPKFILTVPAAWKLPQQNMLLRAAKDAGLYGSIDLVSEPEAAALTTLRDCKYSGGTNKTNPIKVCKSKFQDSTCQKSTME